MGIDVRSATGFLDEGEAIGWHTDFAQVDPRLFSYTIVWHAPAKGGEFQIDSRKTNFETSKKLSGCETPPKPDEIITVSEAGMYFWHSYRQHNVTKLIKGA